MITLDMTVKNTSVNIPNHAFSLETGILTLPISLGTYSLTGKTITAVFDKTGFETAALSSVNGVIQLPITQGLVIKGPNKIQLNIRQGTTLEQSPIMNWYVLESLLGNTPAPTAVDIITSLTALVQAALDSFTEELGEGHQLAYDLQQKIVTGGPLLSGLAIANETAAPLLSDLATPDTGAIDRAIAINATLDTPTTGTIVRALAAEDDLEADILTAQGLEDDLEADIATGQALHNDLADPTTGAIKLAGDVEASLEEAIALAGETQAQLVSTGDTQTTRITAEGDEQEARVTGEGTTQVGMVQAAGASLQETIEGADAINTTLTNTTIPAAQQAKESLQEVIDNSQIGALDELHTNDKSTLVGSINEIFEMQIPAAKRYGFRWDKVNAKGTRLYDAAAITLDTTNFGHFSAVNANYDNPFDGLYPWRDRKLCNVDLALHYANYIAGNTDMTDAVIAWEGDPDFSLPGSPGVFVGPYTPGFWGKADYTTLYNDYIVADMPIAGYRYYKPTIGARWHGVAEGTGINSKVGMPANSETMVAMHARATSIALTLDDIWSYSATSLLATVEYATLNHQTAIGKGVDSVYVQSIRPYIEETAVTRVVMTDAQAANFFTGVIIDIGTSDGGRQIACRIVTSVEDYPADSAYAIVNFDGAAINTLSAHYVSAHGVSNLATPEILSASGYIGNNGKANAFYRGQVHHANLWRYCLGAYRETLTSKIWTSADPAGAAAVDALNTSVHRDTGLVLPTGAAGIALSGYLGGLHQSEIPLAPFGSATGGTDANPVGDYLYVPALTTGNTVLRVGGSTSNGANSGRFVGAWYISATDSAWSIGALPFLKTP